jgi:dTDP-4-dehydrorhamnose reductase
MTPMSASRASAVLARPLVIGASGLVGGAFHHRLSRLGVDVRGTWRTHPRPGLERFSLDEDARALLDRHAPTLVVLASALTHVDYCEQHPEETRARNVEQARPVAAWCADRGVPLVYFSTDYVFDGAAGPYDEDAEPRPINVYGRSKLEAERLVATVPAHLVLRITNVFDLGYDDRNFLVRLVDALRAGREVVVPDDQLATPTYATWLAEHAVTLVDRGLVLAPGTPAVLHVACDDLVSRLDFGRRVARLLGADPALVAGRPTSALGQAAPRPLRGGLRNARLKALLGLTSLPLDGALSDLAPRLKVRS